MRWILLDRFLEVKKGRCAKAVKNISLQEECFQDQLPGYPIMPNTLLLEAMAQTGGVLGGLNYGFKRDLFLAKIEHAVFHEPVVPPAQLLFEAHLTESNDVGCRVEASTRLGDRIVASAKFLLAGVLPEKLNRTESIVFNKTFFRLFQLDQLLANELSCIA